MSAVVCTLNRAPLAREAVRSLADQTLPADQYEILVIDNGSRDGTAMMLAGLAGEIDLRYVLEPRRGIARARNRAFVEARGELLAFLDDDAVAAPCWLQALLDAYGSGDDVVAVGGRTLLRWPGPRPGWLPQERDRYYGGFDLGDERRLMGFPTYPFGVNMAIARASLLAVGGFPPALGHRGGRLTSNEEKFVFRKLSQAGGRVVYEPRALVYHRVFAERVTLGWILRRSFAQGRSNVVEQGLSEPSLPRSRWMVDIVHALSKSAMQSLTVQAPTALAAVRAGSRASHWLGAAWQSAHFSVSPPQPHTPAPGSVPAAGPVGLRVAAHPALQTKTSNPYTSLLCDALREAGATVENLTRRQLLTSRYDIVHVHWPESALRARSSPRAVERTLTLLIALAVARRRGARLVWTMHNLAPHETGNPLMSRALWPAFTRLVDGVICLTESGVEPARRRFPHLRHKPVFVIRHGHYRQHYPDVVTRSEARTELGLADSARVVLSFGRVRPYKNVAALLGAFRQLEDPLARLVVAGRPSSPELLQQVTLAAARDGRVHHHLEFVARHRVQLYFRAADLVVLASSQIFNSGTVLLALSFDRPVLVPALPVFEELQASVGQAWVRTYRGAIDARCLERGLAGGQPRGSAPLDDFGWPGIGGETVAAYRTLVDARHRGLLHPQGRVAGALPRRLDPES